MKTILKTKFQYTIEVKQGANLLTDKIKEYLYNFNPYLFHNDLEGYLYFINTKIDNSDVWIQCVNINNEITTIEISLTK